MRLNQGQGLQLMILVSVLQCGSSVWAFTNNMGHNTIVRWWQFFPRQSKKRAFCCALCTGGCFHGRKSVNTFHTPDATGNIVPPSQNKPNRHPCCLRWLIFPPVSSLSLCSTLKSKMEKKVVFCWSDSWGLVLDNSLVMAAPSAAQSNYCM